MTPLSRRFNHGFVDCSDLCGVRLGHLQDIPYSGKPMDTGDCRIRRGVYCGGTHLINEL